MNNSEYNKLFHDGDPCHTETSPLICSANQWTDFYMIGTFFMKELIRKVFHTWWTVMTSRTNTTWF